MDLSLNDRGSFARVSKALEQEARRLQPEMGKAAEKAAGQFVDELRKSATNVLPNRGGLARDVRDMRVTVEHKSSGARVTPESSYNLQRLNDGVVSHPVHGNKAVWVNQRITPGFWDTAVRKTEPMFKSEGERTLEDSVRRIEKG